ncbi:hypothetical protein DHEL01_v203407 [Diaporthe helianthi]|uniref:F-box domain-containing protein n=1 Tax=Diaporthe helianthi TaxID=158607 RepID=A0A2P5I6Q3_DIAHE|nr:hypothetical protein DHEL01_v203407 [Diaporthe helianthi]
MAIITDLPFEMLNITAADPGLTNRDRKNARLACRKLAAAMTPFTFRRAYISRIKADRDAFLSLAASPHLAAYVEEIIWFELEIDERSFNEENRIEVQLSDGRKVNVFEAARDIFWLPVEPKFQRDGDHDGRLMPVQRSTPECATNFMAQFKAAVARMPKLHTFASEPMDQCRIVSLADNFPFEVGLLLKYKSWDPAEVWSDFLHIFLETIADEKGRINKLHYGNELSGSLVRIDPRYHAAAMPYLVSLELSIADVHTTLGIGHFLCVHNTDHLRQDRDLRRNIRIVRDALHKATELQELSISVQSISEVVREDRPFSHSFLDLITQPRQKVHVWQHLRSLKLESIDASRDNDVLLPLIKAHAKTLRHLQLDQCRPERSFAIELSRIHGLRLDSIVLSDSEFHKPELVSEETLLRFIRRQDVGSKRLVRWIGDGGFMTQNRRPDILEYDPNDEFVAGLAGDGSDHSSECWSDGDSESEAEPEPDVVSASQAHAKPKVSG